MGLPILRWQRRSAALLKGLMLIWLLTVDAFRVRAAGTQVHEAKVSATILAPLPLVHVSEFIPPVIVQSGVVLVQTGQGAWMRQGSVGPRGELPASNTMAPTAEAGRTVDGMSTGKASVAESTAVPGVAVTAVPTGEGRHAHQLRVLVEFN